jgi:alpha-N-arabinofuranosidase
MKILRTAAVVLLACVAWAQDVVINVEAGTRAAYKIPRTIFGTFLEPIGNSIYGGLWAQVLENPSFEENLWGMNQIRRKLEQNPALYRASQLGLPLPWEPLDEKQGTRYEPRWNDAANSYRSVMVMALPDAETGIRQEVYLPVHRTRQYNGTVHVKHLAGPPDMEISLRRRNRPDQVLARTRLQTPSKSWASYSYNLELDTGAVARLEPVDLVLSWTGGTRALVDQVFLWPSDHIDGMDPEMIEMSKALRTPLVRFGGNFTSAYHWEDGIGPMDKRVSMLNLAWGMPEYNHFGTDEFLRFCQLIDAEPQVALNLGSGTPEEAAAWVKYINDKLGRTGLWWELGNELWGDFQTGYPTLGRVAPLTKEFSDAVRKVDPKARLIATGQDPDHFEEWNRAQLSNPVGTFDLLATHFVVGDERVRRARPSPDFVALATFAMPVELERRLRQMRDQIAGTPHRDKAGVAFTEWLFHGPDDRTPRFNNMGGAIAAAGMLHTLIRTADFTPISDMTGLIEFGGVWKKRGRVYGVPAYWAFRMYSTADIQNPVATRTTSETYDIEEGNQRLPQIKDVPYIDTVAALNEKGDRLTLFCINRHLHRDLEARIALAGFKPAREAQVQTLSGTSVYEANSEMEPEAVHPIASVLNVSSQQIRHTFPRASVTVIQFAAVR